MTLTAITRDVDPSISHCELTYQSRVEIEYALAVEQHRRYQAVLSEIGCEVVTIPAAQGLADCVFIEDTAIVLDEVAVLCRPGAASRRPEVAGVEPVLRRFRTLASIQSPGTLDGGDLLRVGKTIYAGLSTRSNQSGIDQLRAIVADHGYTVTAVTTPSCLHLKSAVSQVAPGTLLVNPEWVGTEVFKDYQLIEVDPEEAHAANALLVAGNVIYPTAAFPRTASRLAALGLTLLPVDVSELQKAEGAVTCCSLILNT